MLLIYCYEQGNKSITRYLEQLAAVTTKKFTCCRKQTVALEQDTILVSSAFIPKNTGAFTSSMFLKIHKPVVPTFYINRNQIEINHLIELIIVTCFQEKLG